MTVLCVVAGAGLIGLVLLDIARTVLLPSARGPLSGLVAVVLFRAARAAPAAVRGRITQFAGPASILATIAMWLLLLWIGYALLYLPSVEELAYSSDVRFGDRGVVEALYLSGTALTTLGVGDIVGGSDAIRILTILEAASGLGVFTASISYLPSIYTLVSELRAAALAATDLAGDGPDGAAAAALHGGVGTVATLRREVIVTREHLLRFPQLFYFHPPLDESPLALARSAAGVAVALRWGVDPAHVPHAPHWGRVLETAVLRLLEELDRHAPAAGARARDGAPRAAADRVAATRRAVADIDATAAAPGDAPCREADALLARVDDVLGRVAAMHGYPYRPPLQAAD